jgi:hypothetical protein
VRVQENTQKLLPSLQLVLGKRLEEFGTNFQFSFHAAGLALAFFFAERLKTNQRLVATSDDDFLTFAGLGDEAREVGLGVMDFDRGHIS